MKIFTNPVLKNYGDVSLHTKEHSTDIVSSNSSHKFDVITIQSNKRQIEERTFAEALSKEVISDIKDTASEEKLNDLKNQIALGTYQIDTNALVSKILLV